MYQFEITQKIYNYMFTLEQNNNSSNKVVKLRVILYLSGLFFGAGGEESNWKFARAPEYFLISRLVTAFFSLRVSD